MIDRPSFPYLATSSVIFVIAVVSWILWDNPPAAEVGREAPAFVGNSLDGEPLSSDHFSGRPILLNIWATWCLPCRREMPSIQRIYEDYHGQGLEVVAVSIDGGWDERATRTRVAGWVEELGLQFQVLHDPRRVTERRFSVRGLPETFLIDRDGLIASRVVGAVDWDAVEYRELVAELVAHGNGGTERGGQGPQRDYKD